MNTDALLSLFIVGVSILLAIVVINLVDLVF